MKSLRMVWFSLLFALPVRALFSPFTPFISLSLARRIKDGGIGMGTFALKSPSSLAAVTSQLDLPSETQPVYLRAEDRATRD